MTTPAADITLFVTDLLAEDAGGGAGGGVAGSGTPGKIALWTGATEVGDSAGSQVGGKLLWPSARLNVLECDTIAYMDGSLFHLPYMDGAPGQVIMTDGAGNLSFVTIDTVEEVDMGGDLAGVSSSAWVHGLWGWGLCSQQAPDPMTAGSGTAMIALVFRSHDHGGPEPVLEWGPHLISSFAVTGDVTGTLGSCTVNALQGYGIIGTPPSNNEVLTWSAAFSAWVPMAAQTGPSTITLAGDVTGLSTSTVIEKVRGMNVCADLAGSPVGAMLRYGPHGEHTDEWHAIEMGDIAVSGDVTNTLFASNVVRLRGRDINVEVPDYGDLLGWDSVTSSWKPWAQTDLAVNLSGDVGGSSASNVIENFQGNMVVTGVEPGVPQYLLGLFDLGMVLAWKKFDCQTAFLTTGEVQGSLTGLTVMELFGEGLDKADAPVIGNVLTFTATGWKPLLPGAVSFDPLAGDVTGDFDDNTVQRIWNRAVSGSAPAVGDLFYWSGAEWSYRPSTYWVTLQGSTPGAPDTGHLNVSGTVIGSSSVESPLLRIYGATSGYVDLQTEAVADSITYILPGSDGFDTQVLMTHGGGPLTWSYVGTVTDVALVMPTDEFSVANSPVTGSGELDVTWREQDANKVLAGPTSGLGDMPAFRLLVPDDVPVMEGDAGAGGVAGLVPAPGVGDATKYLRGDATWAAGGAGVSGSATAGQVAYWTDTDEIGGDASLVWDAVNNRLGISVASPAVALELPALTTNNLIKFGTGELGSYTLANSWLTENLYYDGANWKYRATGYGARIQLINGAINLGVAASGTGNATVAELLTVAATSRVGVGTLAPTARLTVSSNTATLPTPTASTYLHLGGADADTCRLLLDSYGGPGGCNLSGRSAANTAASPSALQADSYILCLAGIGYKATAYASGANAQIVFFAAENWTDSACGTYMAFKTTPKLSTTLAEVGRFTDAGRLLIGNTNGTSLLTVAGMIETTSDGVKFPDGTVQTTAAAISSGGSMVVLKETVFAGMGTQSFTNGNTYTLDGTDYVCTISGNGSAAIVAAGLQLRKGTTGGSSKTGMKTIPAGTGGVESILTQERFHRGNWGFWVRLASYDYTNSTTTVCGSANFSAQTYPKYGVSLRRNRNLNGAPNTTTGGLAATYWLNTEPSVTSYPGVSTADVWVAYFRTPSIVDVYYGTWGGSWPAIEDMNLMGTIVMQVTAGGWVSSANSLMGADQMILDFGIEGSVASSGTMEVVFDRWRITSWN